MAEILLGGTADGTSDVRGLLPLTLALSGETVGAASSSGRAQIDPWLLQAFHGVGSFAGSAVRVFNLSGLTSGSSAVVEQSILDIAGTVTGSGDVSAVFSNVMVFQGYAAGSSGAFVWEPEPIYGQSVVSGFMEVIHVPYAICQTPRVPNTLRWGQQFGPGGLTMCVTDKSGNPVGPVCVSYTLYQIQNGCAPKQVGPSGRKPGNSSLGCYYPTGTAGECGQPGLWVIRWSYQISFGAAPIEKDCYFYVFDSVLCPVPGDTLPRNCKYGWD